MNKGYRTRQRDLLVNYLRTHAAARPMAAREIAQGMPAVGETTVYRGLERLLVDGVVRRYPGDEGGYVWQYVGSGSDCSSHVHLKCTECGEVVHMTCDFLRELTAHIADHHNFSLDPGRTVLYGVCGRCRNKEDVHEIKN